MLVVLLDEVIREVKTLSQTNLFNGKFKKTNFNVYHDFTMIENEKSK